MFYITERNNVNVADGNTVVISRKPNPKIDGYIGNVDGVVLMAHGVYETLDDAIEAVHRIFGPVREKKVDKREAEAMFAIGQYTPMERTFCEEWLHDFIGDDIGLYTTDDEIDFLLDKYSDQANAFGYELHCIAIMVLLEYRNRLLANEMRAYL